MYSGKINKYRFEHDSETSRIMVYEDGAGVEPISIIHVSPNLTEKDFHYDIMSWVTNKTEY